MTHPCLQCANGQESKPLQRSCDHHQPQEVSIFAGQAQVVLPMMCANTFLGDKEAEQSKERIREWQVKCRREGFTCGRPSSQGANRDSFAYPFINRSRLSHLLPHTGTYLTGTHSLCDRRPPS